MFTAGEPLWVVNPFNALPIGNPCLRGERVRTSPAEWVEANVRHIRETGPQPWLEELLQALVCDDYAANSEAAGRRGREPVTEWHEINPFTALRLTFQPWAKHARTMAPEEWVAINVRLTEEVGCERWLWGLVFTLCHPQGWWDRWDPDSPRAE
jgi:hypothetical protein